MNANPPAYVSESLATKAVLLMTTEFVLHLLKKQCASASCETCPFGRQSENSSCLLIDIPRAWASDGISKALQEAYGVGRTRPDLSFSDTDGGGDAE